MIKFYSSTVIKTNEEDSFLAPDHPSKWTHILPNEEHEVGDIIHGYSKPQTDTDEPVFVPVPAEDYAALKYLNSDKSQIIEADWTGEKLSFLGSTLLVSKGSRNLRKKQPAGTITAAVLKTSLQPGRTLVTVSAKAVQQIKNREQVLAAQTVFAHNKDKSLFTEIIKVEKGYLIVQAHFAKGGYQTIFIPGRNAGLENRKMQDVYKTGDRVEIIITELGDRGLVGRVNTPYRKERLVVLERERRRNKVWPATVHHENEHGLFVFVYGVSALIRKGNYDGSRTWKSGDDLWVQVTNIDLKRSRCTVKQVKEETNE